MQTKTLITIGKIIAAAILTLGFIHAIATFTPLIQDELICLSLRDFNAVTYISLVCGSSFILCGLLLIILLKKIEQYTFLNTTVIIIGIYLAISGLLAVVYMFDNPFAWIALTLNLNMFNITLGLKKNRKNNYES